MSMYRIPYSAIGFAMLTVIALWDVFADYSPYNEATYHYFKTMRNLPFHFAIVVPGVILVTMIPLFYNLVKYFKFLDILTVFINLPILYAFVKVLIPEEDKLITLNINSSEFQKTKEIIKFWHTLMVPLLIGSIVLQLLASCNSENNLKEKDN